MKNGGRRERGARKAIVIEARIAENGAVVPIEVASNLPGTTSIAVLIDKTRFRSRESSTSPKARCLS